MRLVRQGVIRAGIAGTGSYLPGWRDAGRHPEGSRWAKRGGTIARPPAAATDGEAVSDLALNACVGALVDAGAAAREVDCVVLATDTPEVPIPGSGCALGAKLGLIGVPALEIHVPDSGFLYALSVADHFVRLGTYERVLVAAADATAAGRRADGAGAALVVPRGDAADGILAMGLLADGRFAHPPTLDAPANGVEELLGCGVRQLLRGVEDALRACRLTRSDVALVIASQASSQLARLLRSQLALPSAKLYLDDDVRPTPPGASLPIRLDTAARLGRLTRGDVAVLLSLGTGAASAWGLVRW
jgi:3-oxoacyl-[acyl-carrier-protein] synthase-3